jgi:predicted transposase YbfD/YdcC
MERALADAAVMAAARGLAVDGDQVGPIRPELAHPGGGHSAPPRALAIVTIDVAAIIKVATRTELKDRGRFDTRYYADLTAEAAANAVRGHWGIENRLHWVLDVVFDEDQSRLRTGHGARNMAVVRHFAINLVRQAKDNKSIRLRRKLAGWDHHYLASILDPKPR